MIYIEDKNEIIKHNSLVNELIDKTKTKEFVYQNVFNNKFKYILFVDECEFGEYLFDGLEAFLKTTNEVDFFVQCLPCNKYVVPYSFDKKNIIAYQNMKEEYESSSPHEFFIGLDDACLEYLYYTKTGNWCGWFDKLWEVGIFAFETEALVKNFIKSFNTLDEYSCYIFYTPEQVVNQIWFRPKKKYVDAFLKNYSNLSYLLNGEVEKGTR